MFLINAYERYVRYVSVFPSDVCVEAVLAHSNHKQVRSETPLHSGSGAVYTSCFSFASRSTHSNAKHEHLYLLYVNSVAEGDEVIDFQDDPLQDHDPWAAKSTEPELPRPREAPEPTPTLRSTRKQVGTYTLETTSQEPAPQRIIHDVPPTWGVKTLKRSWSPT